MRKETALKLNELNMRFYERACASFSETRQAPWPGWERVFQLMDERFGIASEGAPAPLCILDLACGNLRFERALAQRCGSEALRFYAVDNCDELLTSGLPLSYRHLDIISALLEKRGLSELDGWPAFDVVALFGFMHHVPGFENRLQLLREAAKRAKGGALLAASFWCFMDDEKLAAKARETTGRALAVLPDEDLAAGELEEDDFFIGWQKEADLFRYCHHFADEELDRLAAALQEDLRLVARFKADGRTDSLNSYLVFEVR